MRCDNLQDCPVLKVQVKEYVSNYVLFHVLDQYSSQRDQLFREHLAFLPENADALANLGEELAG